jgi:hypothetical protein
MSQGQILGALRIVLPVILAYLAGTGWISESDVGSITTAVVTLAATIWSVVMHNKSNTIASAAALPEVNKIEMMSSPEGIALRDKVGSTPTATVTVAISRP